MFEVGIDYDAETGILSIAGELEELLRDRAAGLYLQRRGGQPSSSNGKICYMVSPENVVLEYNRLFKLFSRSGGKVISSDNVSSSISKAEQELREFESFSDQARKIWDADFASAEFEEFVNILKSTCLGRVFYRLQLLSAFHIAFSQNACNFSVPGAGKTSVVYAAFAYLNSLPEDHPKHVNHLVIVGPLSCFDAWETEFRDIFLRAPMSKRLAGFVSPSDRLNYFKNISIESRRTEMTLTSYPTVASNKEVISHFLNTGTRKSMLVLDEAHYVKGHDGVWSSAILEISGSARSRVVLTGTPAPNGYEDLANLFKFLYPNRNLIGFSRHQLLAMTEGRMGMEGPKRLQENLQPFFTRIRKKDLNLPEIRTNIVPVEMSIDQETIYRFIEEATIPALVEPNDTVKATLGRAKLIRLRQAATNPSLLLKPLEEEGFTTLGLSDISIADANILSLIKGFDRDADLPKVETTRNLVKTLLAEHKKVLIWSVFIGNLFKLKDALSDLVDEVDVIYGATPVDSSVEDESNVDLSTREAILNRFKSRGKTSILIANPQTLGESISLHKACHAAIYFDCDFNAGRFIQSKDRIHRVGLKKEQLTHYYFLQSQHTIDIDIHQRLIAKETRLNQLVDSNEIPLFSIALGEDEGLEDIRAVIASYESRMENG